MPIFALIFQKKLEVGGTEKNQESKTIRSGGGAEKN